MPNSQWQIAFGPYSLAVDRRILRFVLRDIKAGIDWADNLSLGWIALENRESSSATRHDFGDCTIVSVSEKAGAQGKRILFGLDAPGGVPVDVYVICTEREIQLTVEASRDTKTHRVVGFGLVPGLVSVPDDGASYLVLPAINGIGRFARGVPSPALWQKSIERRPYLSKMTRQERYAIWAPTGGVRMPFVGAVRAKEHAKSVADAPAGSLALITDSAYGSFVLEKPADGAAASVDLEYEGDPERRRLDVRLVVLPGENHVGIGTGVPGTKSLAKKTTSRSGEKSANGPLLTNSSAQHGGLTNCRQTKTMFGNTKPKFGESGSHGSPYIP